MNLIMLCVIVNTFFCRIPEDGASKRPRLTVDTSRDCQPLCEALSSNESFTSNFIG